MEYSYYIYIIKTQLLCVCLCVCLLVRIVLERSGGIKTAFIIEIETNFQENKCTDSEFRIYMILI